jgi:hypothetical protein
MGEFELANIDKETVGLLGFWLFTAIQFAKGKVWRESWTAGVSMLAPFGLAAVVVFGGPLANQYAQTTAILFLIASGTYAVTKAKA